MINPFKIKPNLTVSYNDDIVVVYSVNWLKDKEIYPIVIYYSLDERCKKEYPIHLYKSFWIDFVMNAKYINVD